MSYNPPRYLFRRFEILRRVRAGGAFLEIGPGNLNLAQELLAYFDRGTLVDFNPQVEAIFNNLHDEQKRRLDLVIAEFPHIGQSTRPYDCVVACEVLEHVEDDETFVEQVYSLLKVGGQLILSVPSGMRNWSVHDEIVGHYRRYEKVQIIEILSKHRFKRIAVVSYGYPFVNILRIPRVLLAKVQYANAASKSMIDQTKQSGVIKDKLILRLMGVFLNKYTVFPLGHIASQFGDFDISDGYVITAVKY